MSINNFNVEKFGDYKIGSHHPAGSSSLILEVVKWYSPILLFFCSTVEHYHSCLKAKMK